jgi:thioredoxin 1
LVSFSAAKCGLCKALHPIIDKIAEANSKVKFAQLDIAAYPIVANKYKVSALPTILLFHSGMINQFVGKPTKEALVKFISIV